MNLIRSNVLVLKRDDVVDFYGFIGQMCSDASDRVSQASPIYSEVIVSIQFILNSLPDGKEGLLEFHSLLFLSRNCNFN